MSDDETTESNVIPMNGTVDPPCDIEPPCESIPGEGYKLNHFDLPKPKTDMVNSPPHYKQGKYELVDIIEHIIKDYKPVQAYHIATVVKYLGRAPYKGNLDQDLRKAFWHLRRAIKAK